MAAVRSQKLGCYSWQQGRRIYRNGEGYSDPRRFLTICYCSVIIENDKLMFEQTRLDGRVELFKVNLDGTNLTRIIEFNSSITVPTTSWSPNGKRIAYESCTSSGCAIVLMSDVGKWRIPIIGGTTPAFSHDETRLAFSRITGLYCGCTARSRRL